MERKSGVLVLTRSVRAKTGPATETARLFMREGRVVRARIDARDDIKNADSVYYALGWSTGRFEFTPFDVDMADEVQSSTTALLMEGARRIDEANRP